MKKLLAFVLVLGLASIATAGLTVTPSEQTVNVGDTVIITVGTDTNLTYGDGISNMWFGIKGANATMKITSQGQYQGMNPAWTGWSAKFSDARDQDGNATVYFSAAVDSMTGPVLAGDLFEMTFEATEEGIFTFAAFADPVAATSATLGGVAYPVEQLPTASVTVVPEPMTMSLLGLGGLAMIRRRRKA
ncbi:MAG: PEP-CTERM sorting domain-containing protein [Phycisphaerae bacterium]|nr:PEP-CTERM sorting domain-containing protein [Phycisphaerae bacterium]